MPTQRIAIRLYLYFPDAPFQAHYVDTVDDVQEAARFVQYYREHGADIRAQALVEVTPEVR